ncbi:carbohydrate ABC transporter permease [Halegenticoccus tardaugens]|uniref:carbohydrate ABC transporter permease n=1 Tax=Halegenticoccus tardaugens TaxID=2071624 RepID=UPI00100B787E|nr:carbohydrate ABC transporter permease [Halegenticoccus tardaugens]
MSSQQYSLKSTFESLSGYTAATYAVYGLAMVFFLFPVLWVISMSLRQPGEVLSYPVQFFPRDMTFQPYVDVLEDSDMLLWVVNSIKIAVLEVIGILLVTVPGAYAFSRFDFRGKKPVLFGVLLFQMISPVVIVIPLYNMMAKLDLLDTHSGLILLYIGLQVPFSIWLLKSYFDTIPAGLDEAARVDGCSRLQTLIYVLLPSLAPGIAVVAIFNFVFSWAEFVMAFTVLGESDLYTVSIGLFSFQGQYSTDWRVIAAASVIAMVPILIMFVGLQRYFVKGLVEGAVKG